MRPGPKKPGESAAEYSARVKAMEQKWMSGMGRPKTGSGSPKGDGGSRPRGTSPAPGYGGGKPKVSGPRGLKSGGMVKGKK